MLFHLFKSHKVLNKALAANKMAIAYTVLAERFVVERCIVDSGKFLLSLWIYVKTTFTYTHAGNTQELASSAYMHIFMPNNIISYRLSEG